MDYSISPEAIIKIQFGQFVESQMKEREEYLKRIGKINKDRKFSRAELGKNIGVSTVWINSIINGEKLPNDELILLIADFLEIEEHELFKVARRIHPTKLKEYQKEYLGEYFIEGM